MSNYSPINSPSRFDHSSPKVTSTSYLGGSTFLSPNKMGDFGSSSFHHPTSSNAVLNAMRALKEKIQKLEDERNFYKDAFEKEKRERERDMDLYQREKSMLNSTRGNIEIEKNTLESELSRVKERQVSVEQENRYFRTLIDGVNQEKKEKDLEILQGHKVQEELKANIQTLNRSVKQNEELIEKLTEKNQRLSKAIVDERRHRERLEEEKERLDHALKDLVSLHSSLTSTMLSKKKKKSKKPKTKSAAKTKPVRRKSSVTKSRLSSTVPWMSGLPGTEFNINAIASMAMNHLNEDLPLNPQNLYNKENTETLFQDLDLNRNISEVIHQLQSECKALRKDYNKYVAKIQNQEPGKDESTKKLQKIYDMLQRKATQLKRLKKYQSVVNENIRMTNSASPNVRGVEKKVKTMQLYRNLKLLAQESS